MSSLPLDRLVADTAALVRIDSQNPGPGEGRVAAWVCDRLTQAGMEPRRQPVDDGRDNVLCEVRGSGEAPRLILLAHMDTVPVGTGWTRPPLDGDVQDGRLYGRGAADMKAGLAVALNLLEHLHRGATPHGDVLLAATVDEEGPRMAGAHALAAAGLVRPGDQVLALEPTGLRLRIAQVGLQWVELNVVGRMAHAGRAHLGVNANHVAARIVERLAARVEALPHRDELLGRPLFTCGRIDGGVATNVVAGACRAELDLRIVPPLTPDDAVALAREVCDEVVTDFPGASVRLNRLGASRPPVRAAEDAPVVLGLRQAHREVTGTELASGGADGHEAYTDASMLASLANSRSCTVYGPGSSDRAHVSDEYVEISDLQTAGEVLVRMLAGWSASVQAPKA
jgi:succinyl-diaminopimelate desuccinylase